jgi:predicted DNA-binding protein with PD1-like motif
VTHHIEISNDIIAIDDEKTIPFFGIMTALASPPGSSIGGHLLVGQVPLVLTTSPSLFSAFYSQTNE